MAETLTRTGPTQLATTTATIKTAPTATGGYTILRSILVTNADASTRTVTIGIGTTNADAPAKRVWTNYPLVANETVELIAEGGFLLLNGGATPDLLYALADVASMVNITVSMVDGP